MRAVVLKLASRKPNAPQEALCVCAVTVPLGWRQGGLHSPP